MDKYLSLPPLLFFYQIPCLYISSLFSHFPAFLTLVPSVSTPIILLLIELKLQCLAW